MGASRQAARKIALSIGNTLNISALQAAGRSLEAVSDASHREQDVTPPRLPNIVIRLLELLGCGQMSRMQVEQIVDKRLPTVNVDDLFEDLDGVAAVVTDEAARGRGVAEILCREALNRASGARAPPSSCRLATFQRRSATRASFRR